MKRLAVFAFLLGVVTGLAFSTAFVGRSALAQQIAPGVMVSTFKDGTTCYTNSNGGIHCFR